MENTLKSTSHLTHSGAGHQAYTALKMAFVAAPLLAGLDKFFNLMTDWTQYLAPIFPEMLNVSPQTFMMGVGIIEIVAALGVALKPRIFGLVVAAWMVGIIFNLFMLGKFYDIALRDLGLAIGALAMARLAVEHDHQAEKTERRTGGFNKLQYD